MVVSINIRMDFDGDDHDLEYKLENTSLSEEGAGFIQGQDCWNHVQDIS